MADFFGNNKPTGPQGAAGGPQGAAGSTGVQGVSGSTGVQGAKGLQGPIGNTGVQGTTGSNGSGVQGLTGSGTQGSTGQAGVQGHVGVQGANPGPAGVQGPQGYGKSGLNTESIFTTNQNDFAPQTNAYLQRWSSSLSVSVSGLSLSQVGGDYYVIVNVGTNPIVFTKQDSNSIPPNRFNASITLLGDEQADVIYDSVSARWRITKR